MKKIFFLSLTLLISFAVSSIYADDFLAPSATPPGGLATSNVPQFVIIGFDDNLEAEGMKWILDYSENLKNPAGSSQSETYDGSDVRFSFYCNTRNGFDTIPADLIAQEKRAYALNNEIGNHTAHHWHTATKTAEALVVNAPKSAWASEISLASSDLVGLDIVPAKEIVAFRTPFLEYNDSLFQVLKDSGFVYDCSIEEGGQYQDGEQDGTNYLWPYTLDNGSPGHNDGWMNDADNPDKFKVNGVAGLWELANHLIIVPPDNKCAEYGVPEGLRTKVALNIAGDTTGDPSWFEDMNSSGKITGFDYNLWTIKDYNAAELDSAEVLAILKYTLDLRLQGNRAPFMFGAHTQFYTANADKIEEFPKSTFTSRRWAIQEFIKYALSKSEVRMVPGIKVIDWCRAPVGLDGTLSVFDPMGKKSFGTNIKNVTNKSITLNITKSGNYSIKLFALNGKQIASINRNFSSKGIKTINYKNSGIAENLYIVNLSGDGVNHTVKSVIK